MERIPHGIRYFASYFVMCVVAALLALSLPKPLPLPPPVQDLDARLSRSDMHRDVVHFVCFHLGITRDPGFLNTLGLGKKMIIILSRFACYNTSLQPALHFLTNTI